MFPIGPVVFFCRQNSPNGSRVVHIRRLFGFVTVATQVAKSISTPTRILVMQHACLAIESTGYVVIVNELLMCNVVPPGVRKLNKQAVDFGYVVIVKLNSGVEFQSH